MNKIPAENQFLEPINNKKESKSTKHAKTDILNSLTEKQPHEVFEQYVNAELKLKILEEKNKNTTKSFNVEDLKTFNLTLLLTGYHSLPGTRKFWEKEYDIGLSIVSEAISRKKFEDFKSFIHFDDNNALDTSDKFAKVRSLFDIMNKGLKRLGFFHTVYSIDK